MYYSALIWPKINNQITFFKQINNDAVFCLFNNYIKTTSLNIFRLLRMAKVKIIHASFIISSLINGWMNVLTDGSEDGWVH